uniref:Peptidase S1 domain-containing protein n=1 Tax=Stomoxys calcitrans TaxID=35570 RepID=A0A1I8QC07_STOCA
MGTDSLIQNTPFTLQFDVAELVVHEAFNFKTLVNNVAMFLITDFIPWDWPTVEAIPLNINSEVNGVICTTTGWNLTEDNASSSILRESIVPITNRSLCQELYGDLTSDLLCAGFRENSPHAFCEGDTGGPLVCSGYLTGIILEGNSCAETGFLGLYVNVLYHYNWIIAKNKTFDYGHVVPIYDDTSLDYYNSNDDARQPKNFGNVWNNKKQRKENE